MFEVSSGRVQKMPGEASAAPMVVFWLLALVFGGVGVGLTYPSFRARGWDTAPGTVLTSQVHSQRGSKGGSTHACRVVYAFEVAGRRYEGRKLDMLEVHSSGRGAFEDQAQFAPGTACVVHYNPGDPSESCLRPGPGALQIVFLSIGTLLLGGALLATAAWWWKRNVPATF